jgi:CRP-like cAMP-binding protein
MNLLSVRKIKSHASEWPFKMSAKTRRDFDPTIFLSTIGDGRQIVSFRKKQIIFAQGDTTDAVFVIQKGRVKLSAKSKAGMEATLSILTKRHGCRR